MSSKNVLVPKLSDNNNQNAQIINSKQLLSRFCSADYSWKSAYYHDPKQEVMKNSQVTLTRLVRNRWWPWQMILFYQKSADAVFYPGAEWFDLIGLKLRKLWNPQLPIISTFEGIGGDKDREKKLSRIMGHEVFCHNIAKKKLQQFDQMYQLSTHIISLSPFLGKICSQLYHREYSVLPLGIDTNVFHSKDRISPAKPTVLAVGRVEQHKRPQLLLRMAEEFPEANFKWLGEGSLRKSFVDDCSKRNIGNIQFPGALSNEQLAAEMRAATILVIPSFSEGVPKVSQEAAACGLPVILFGHYHAPTVLHNETGFVVWDDDEMLCKLGELIGSSALIDIMGKKAAHMAKQWSWTVVAPQWENKIRQILALGH